MKARGRRPVKQKTGPVLPARLKRAVDGGQDSQGSSSAKGNKRQRGSMFAVSRRKQQRKRQRQERKQRRADSFQAVAGVQKAVQPESRAGVAHKGASATVKRVAPKEDKVWCTRSAFPICTVDLLGVTSSSDPVPQTQAARKRPRNSKDVAGVKDPSAPSGQQLASRRPLTALLQVV